MRNIAISCQIINKNKSFKLGNPYQATDKAAADVMSLIFEAGFISALQVMLIQDLTYSLLKQP